MKWPFAENVSRSMVKIKIFTYNQNKLVLLYTRRENFGVFKAITLRLTLYQSSTREILK